MPDGTVIASGDAAPAGRIKVSKEGGSVRGQITYEGEGRRVDYNDLGYMRRQNQHDVFAAVSYLTLGPWWETLETGTALGVQEQDTPISTCAGRLRGERLEAQELGRCCERAHRPSHYDDREVGDARPWSAPVGRRAIWHGPRARVRGGVLSSTADGRRHLGRRGGRDPQGAAAARRRSRPPIFHVRRCFFGGGRSAVRRCAEPARARHLHAPPTLEAYAQAFSQRGLRYSAFS
jgi:hypothetical protein